MENVEQNNSEYRLLLHVSLWNEGRIDELLYESRTIQDCLKAPENATNIPKTSKKIQSSNAQGKVNGALKLLTNRMSNGILPFSNKTLDLLKQEHAEPEESSPENSSTWSI